MHRRDFLKGLTCISASSVLSLRSESISAARHLTENSSTNLLVNTKQAFELALEKTPALIGLQSAQGNFTSQPLTIEGCLPADINGVFYRNGPANFERGDQRYTHPFEGDGMIQSFTFADGKITHQGKFVQTPKFIKEQQHNRFLYSGPKSRLDNSLSVSSADTVNTANINVIAVNDEIWALWEAGSATALDAETLTTKRRVDLGEGSSYGKKLKGLAFSAHPKIEANGDIWNFGLSPTGHIVLYHLSAKGIVKNVGMINANYQGKMLHDFLITEKHLLLILPSVTTKTGSLVTKGLFNSIQYDSNLPMRVLVISKQSLKLVKQYELAAGFAFHYGNAWEENNGTIHFDGCIDNNMDVMDELSELMSGELRSLVNSTKTVLYTLHTNGTSSSNTVNGSSEFPRIYPHLTGKRHQQLFTLSHTESKHWRDTVCCLDIETGKKQQFVYGKNFIVEEHIIVSQKAKEGSGYLMGTALHVPSKRSCVNIFKANRLDDGPVCRAWLPDFLPLGLHGNFKAN